MLMKKLLDKSGNHFVIGLLIICGAIGIATIFLTAQDYRTNINIDDIPTNSTVTSSSIILEVMDNQELALQQMIIRESGKVENNNQIDKYVMKNSIDFGANGSVTIREQYVDDKESIYLCDVKLVDGNSQYIKVIMYDELGSTRMYVVDENGKSIDEKINLPLAISQEIISSITELYNMRKGE